MPIQDMHEQFLLWYDKQSNFTSPEVTAEEIDIYLNNAQYQFLKILTEKGLEKSQEWLDYTKNITVSAPAIIPTPSGNKPRGYYVTLPADYRLALLEEATITFTGCGPSPARVPVVPVTRDEYSKIVMNPFRKPWKEEIIRLTSDGAAPTGGQGRFELIGSSTITNITAYYLDYIREPARIQFGSRYATPIATQSCELESKAATKIVEIAVELALKTMGDNRLSLEQYDKLTKTI